MSKANPVYDLMYLNDEHVWKYFDTHDTLMDARECASRSTHATVKIVPYYGRPINIWMWLHGRPKSSIECIETGRSLREARYLLGECRMVYQDTAMVWMGAKNQV